MIFSFIFGICAGIGLLAHHKWKYGIFFHRLLLDHGMYGIELVIIGTLSFML